MNCVSLRKRNDLNVGWLTSKKNRRPGTVRRFVTKMLRSSTYHSNCKNSNSTSRALVHRPNMRSALSRCRSKALRDKTQISKTV